MSRYVTTRPVLLPAGMAVVLTPCECGECSGVAGHLRANVLGGLVTDFKFDLDDALAVGLVRPAAVS